MKNEENFSCEQSRNLLVEFADNSLKPLQKQCMDQHLSHCEACNEAMEQIWEMQALSTRWTDEAVPRWSRKKTFFEPTPLFGSMEWFPKLQLASTFATMLVLVLVLGNAQISTSDGLHIQFGASDKNYLTNSDLEQKISFLQDQLNTQHREQLQRNVSDLASIQSATNQLLLKTILERSREERREDIDTLLANWYQSQDQQTEYTNESLRALLVSQLEDKRNINQINKLLHQASLEGNSL